MGTDGNLTPFQSGFPGHQDNTTFCGVQLLRIEAEMAE